MQTALVRARGTAKATRVPGAKFRIKSRSNTVILFIYLNEQNASHDCLFLSPCRHRNRIRTQTRKLHVNWILVVFGRIWRADSGLNWNPAFNFLPKTLESETWDTRGLMQPPCWMISTLSATFAENCSLRDYDYCMCCACRTHAAGDGAESHFKAKEFTLLNGSIRT